MFCVPNHRFPELLWGRQVLDKLGLHKLAASYSRFFNKIARHAHTDSSEVWEKRLNAAGLEVEQTWDYFPPEALHVLEWGTPSGNPCLVQQEGVWKVGVGADPLETWRSPGC